MADSDSYDANMFENKAKQILIHLGAMAAITPTIVHWYIQAENITNLYNYEQKAEIDKINEFEHNLGPLITQLSPIILKQYLSESRKPYIINFLEKLTYRCRTLSTSTWLDKTLLLLFYNELKQNMNFKHAVLLMFANISVHIHCFNDYKTKQLLMENNFVAVIYNYFQRMNKENDGKFEGNEISFTLYIVGWSSDANNEYLKSMIMDEKLNALDMALSELKCALNNEQIEYEAISFVPAVWNRISFINILMDNEQYQQILMEKDILLYLSLALRFEEKQKRDTVTLQKQCCEALWKLCDNHTEEIHAQFLKYQFGEYDLWIYLDKLSEINTTKQFVKQINVCMRKYYFNVTNTLTNLSVDCYLEIVSFIW